MIIDMQKQVIANVLLKPEIAAFIELDDSWFIDPVDQKIISVITITPASKNIRILKKP